MHPRRCIRRWLRRGGASCPLCNWDVKSLFDRDGNPLSLPQESIDNQGTFLVEALAPNIANHGDFGDRNGPRSSVPDPPVNPLPPTRQMILSRESRRQSDQRILAPTPAMPHPSSALSAQATESQEGVDAAEDGDGTGRTDGENSLQDTTPGVTVPPRVAIDIGPAEKI